MGLAYYSGRGNKAEVQTTTKQGERTVKLKQKS